MNLDVLLASVYSEITNGNSLDKKISIGKLEVA